MSGYGIAFSFSSFSKTTVEGFSLLSQGTRLLGFSGKVNCLEMRFECPQAHLKRVLWLTLLKGALHGRVGAHTTDDKSSPHELFRYRLEERLAGLGIRCRMLAAHSGPPIRRNIDAIACHHMLQGDGWKVNCFALLTLLADLTSAHHGSSSLRFRAESSTKTITFTNLALPTSSSCSKAHIQNGNLKMFLAKCIWQMLVIWSSVECIHPAHSLQLRVWFPHGQAFFFDWSHNLSNSLQQAWRVNKHPKSGTM